MLEHGGNTALIEFANSPLKVISHLFFSYDCKTKQAQNNIRMFGDDSW